MINFKMKLLNYGVFRRVSQNQYVSKTCPICGDIKSHFYLKIDVRDDGPILCHCFKCNFGGFLNSDMLNKMGIENIEVPHFRTRKRIQNTRTVSFKTVDDDDRKAILDVSGYINSRVNHYPTLEELKAFRFISDARMYCMEYGLHFEKPAIFHGRYWFGLTNGNLVGRSKNYNDDRRWLKQFATNIDSMNIYNVRFPFDLTSDITVMISEGVMDSIGLYYLYKHENCIFISVLGKDYQCGLQYLINRGIYGDSVTVRIYKDSDVDTKSIEIDNNLKALFHKVEVWRNAIGHDFGEPDVSPEKCIEWR